MESDSLWLGELDDETNQSIRHLYARAAFTQYVDGHINEKSFLMSLQRLLSVRDTKTPNQHGKRLFNSKDRELIGELIQLSTLTKSKNARRARGNIASSPLLKRQAVAIAIFLFNERPDAMRKEVEARVYQLMAVDGGEFIHSLRTIQTWLTPFFQARSKKHNDL